MLIYCDVASEGGGGWGRGLAVLGGRLSRRPDPNASHRKRPRWADARQS